MYFQNGSVTSTDEIELLDCNATERYWESHENNCKDLVYKHCQLFICVYIFTYGFIYVYGSYTYCTYAYVYARKRTHSCLRLTHNSQASILIIQIYSWKKEMMAKQVNNLLLFALRIFMKFSTIPYELLENKTEYENYSFSSIFDQKSIY